MKPETWLANAEILRKQFEAASTTWPNAEAIFLTWPEDSPRPDKLPSDLDSQSAVPVAAPPGELHWVALGFHRGDTPAQRYRHGFAGELLMRRDFGVFSRRDEIHDPAEYRAWTERFKALANSASNVLGDAPTFEALSASIMAWNGQTRWLLTVFATMQPSRHALASSSVQYEAINDIFLASAQALTRLMEMVTICTAANGKSEREKRTAPPGSQGRNRIIEARDKWLYEQCRKQISYGVIRNKLKLNRKRWPIIGTNNGIRDRASNYARRHNLPQIPLRREALN